MSTYYQRVALCLIEESVSSNRYVSRLHPGKPIQGPFKYTKLLKENYLNSTSYSPSSSLRQV